MSNGAGGFCHFHVALHFTMFVKSAWGPLQPDVMTHVQNNQTTPAQEMA